MVVTKMKRSKFNFHVKEKATASASAIRAKTMTSVGSVFSTVLGNKRSSLAKYPSKVKKNDDSDSGNGKDQWHNFAWASPKPEPEPEPEPVRVSLSHLLTLEETMEPDQAGKLGKQNRKSGKINISVPLLRFLDKKKGWDNFVRTVKISKSDLYLYRDGVVTKFGQVMRRKVRSWRLVRIPSKLVVIRLKLKMIKSVMKKKVTKKGDREDNDDRELCRKRILMGGRCKPLCSSGTLSYDTNGFLLPEIY